MSRLLVDVLYIYIMLLQIALWHKHWSLLSVCLTNLRTLSSIYSGLTTDFSKLPCGNSQLLLLSVQEQHLCNMARKSFFPVLLWSSTSSTRQEFLSFSSKPLTGDLMFNLVKSLHFYYETREGEDKRTKDQQKNFKILRISHWLSCSHVIAQLGSYWLRQA